MTATDHIIVPDFDEETHTYRVDGRIVPSVTGILKYGPWKGVSETDNEFVIPEDVIENSRERGVRVHKAIELLNKGTLDWDSLEEEDLPYVTAYSDWRDATGYVSVCPEQIGYSVAYDYAYTRDDYGYIGDEMVVVDIKTGSAGLKPWHKVQLAAYAHPLRFANEKEGAKIWPLRIMLHLKSNAKAKPYHFSEATAQWDWEVFLACRKLAIAAELDGEA